MGSKPRRCGSSGGASDKVSRRNSVRRNCKRAPLPPSSVRIGSKISWDFSNEGLRFVTLRPPPNGSEDSVAANRLEGCEPENLVGCGKNYLTDRVEAALRMSDHEHPEALLFE